MTVAAAGCDAMERDMMRDELSAIQLSPKVAARRIAGPVWPPTGSVGRYYYG